MFGKIFITQLRNCVMLVTPLHLFIYLLIYLFIYLGRSAYTVATNVVEYCRISVESQSHRTCNQRLGWSFSFAGCSHF